MILPPEVAQLPERVYRPSRSFALACTVAGIWLDRNTADGYLYSNQVLRSVHNAWRHEPHDDSGGTDTWSDFHQILFRAERETANLVISDWLYPTVPTGPVGQELLFNFIQVEPYLIVDDK